MFRPAEDVRNAAAEPESWPRLRVLTVVDHYLPGFKGGGPVRSVSNLVAALAGKVDFDVVTADRDLGDAEPYSGVDPGSWRPLGPGRVRYLARSDRSVRGWRSLLGADAWDVVYLNSLFSRTTIKLLLMRRMGELPALPFVIAPRGELSPGALSVHWRRKALWLEASKRMDLYRGVDWQAATPGERQDILRMVAGNGASARVHTARHVPPRGASLSAQWPGSNPSRPKRPGSARLVFVSRITPVKNLDYALRVLSAIEGDVEFDIYGPIEDRGYWRRCQRLVRTGMQVRYCGALPREAVVPTFARYHAFLFPTRGESFGQVVFESLTAGCPVVISDRTPWTRLAARKAGWDLALGRPSDFAACIEAIRRMDDEAFAAYSAGASGLASDVARDWSGADAHLRMFRSAAGLAPGVGDGQERVCECTM
jgi:glycosyltransferase involved in cell wall biosynthesis